MLDDTTYYARRRRINDPGLARPSRLFYCSLCSQESSGQSGRGADDPRGRISANSPSTKAYVDLVHEWVVYRHEVLRAPVRTLAAEIGISKSAVDRFYKLRSHPGKNWPKLRDWYMRTRKSTVEEYQTPPELTLASALHTLAEVPSSQRAHALRVIAENYRALFTELRMPMPDWVRMLSDVAKDEAPS